MQKRLWLNLKYNNGFIKTDSMNTTMKKMINTLYILLLSLSSIQLAAEDSSHAKEQQPKWYQVELFIFANNTPNSNTDERWPRELSLKYPKQIIELRPAVTADSLLPVLEKNAQRYNDELAAMEPAINPAIAPNIDPDSETANINELNTNSGMRPPELQADGQQQPAHSGEAAFILLSKDQYQLGDVVKRTLAQADFRLLFHQAWRQPMDKRYEAAHLLIRGGDQFDSHYELEGSINLSVARYLHLTTDLWLSTFVSNLGREEDPWPVLPAVSLAEASSQSRSLFNRDSYTNGASLQAFSNPFADIAGNQYSVDQTVTLRQHRRMRSNELHYIDHPLMGLIIKITPYDGTQEVDEP